MSRHDGEDDQELRRYQPLPLHKVLGHKPQAAALQSSHVHPAPRHARLGGAAQQAGTSPLSQIHLKLKVEEYFPNWRFHKLLPMTDQSGSCEYEYISDLHNVKVHQLNRGVLYKYKVYPKIHREKRNIQQRSFTNVYLSCNCAKHNSDS